VDETALVKPAQRRDDADRMRDDAFHLHRHSDGHLERLAARIIQHQNGPTAVAYELARPYRPCLIELVSQSVFVDEAFDGRGRRVLCRGHRE
jgi:hypothetical protein